MNADSHKGYRFGPFVLNLQRLRLQHGNGTDIELRPKAFDVLRVLIERAGRLVSKDELVGAVWPNVIVNDDALAQCVRDIRKALADDGERFIRTVPRRGYEFVGEVTPMHAVEETAGSAVGETRARRWGSPILAGATLALVIVVLAAWSGGWLRTSTVVPNQRLTIAVLPFIDAAAPSDDWLGEGIAEDIMTAVSRFRDILVIGRNSTFRFRDPTTDPKEVGAELGADFLLQGSVQRSGERLRIIAQLVDARTGASHWTERYDRPFADVFDIQDEVAASIATQLVVHAKEATVTRLRSRAPQNLEAYELALRGRKAYRTFSHEGTIEARTLAERAIAIDPNYAAAWEVLASALLQFYYQPFDENQHTPAILQQARSAAEKAVWLDSNFSTGQAILAATLLPATEHHAALEVVEKAISLNPNDPVALGVYGNVLSFLAHYEKSIEAWENVERIDPFVPPLNFALKAMPHIMLGEYAQALHLTRSCEQRAPRLYPCVLYQVIAAQQLGLEEEARDAVKRMQEIYPDFSIARHMRILPFRDKAEATRLADYMRRAGLPE